MRIIEKRLFFISITMIKNLLCKSRYDIIIIIFRFKSNRRQLVTYECIYILC
jgi:hypothetical protein